MAFSPPGETRRKVYRWVREQILAGHSPALREVQQAFGFRSLESARAQLEQLVRDGLLTKREGETRCFAFRKPDADRIGKCAGSQCRKRRFGRRRRTCTRGPAAP